jgi:hypothetical protein
VISGNGTYGMLIWGSGKDGNTVEGNYIGTDVSGTVALPNGESGVYIGVGAENNTIGGAADGEGNLIAFNDEWWRKEVSRLYFELALEDERTLTVYRDLVTGRWSQQNYG